MVGKCASPQQNRILPKRSILPNVVDLEEAAMRADLTEDAPAMFLVDLEAAFPSVDHGFMVKTLSRLGMPAGAMNFIDLLCHNTAGKISHGKAYGATLPHHVGYPAGVPA